MKTPAFVCLLARSISTAVHLGTGRARHFVVFLAGAFSVVSVLCCQTEAQTAHSAQATGVNFGNVNVRSSSATASLSFTFDTAGQLGTSVVLTQGTTGLDFADAGTGTCTTNGATHTYNAGDSCTVNVTFTPRYPGTRYGAAILKGSAGNVIATGYAYGTGIGPQVAFLPGALTTIAAPGLDHPTGVAVDASNNVYVTDTSNNRVLRETPSGVSYTESLLLSSGLNAPFGIAVDGAGNLYIVDALNRRVLKETLTVAGYSETVLVSTGLHSPTGVAVDGSGNVYYADSPSNSGSLGVQRIVKKTLTGNTYTDSTVADVTAGLDNPIGVAVDGAGNVYIADTDIGKVWKETLSAGAYTQTTVGSGLNYPNGVTVDGVGNVYIADRGNLRLLKETPSGSTYTQTTLATGLTPWGLAVDATGNVYAADYDRSLVLKLDLADPPTLNFADTNVGATSSDSPQTVTLQNIGNGNLTFPLPSAGRSPSISIGFTLGGSGTCPQLTTSSFGPGTLTPGSSCTLPVSFTPTAPGINHGSLVLTDDALNTAPSATQTVLLNGTGTGAATTPQAVLSPVSLSFGSLTTGSTSVAQAITLSNPGTGALSITSIVIAGTNAAQFAQTSSCGATLAAGASCSISVTFTPAAVATYSAVVSVTDNATGSPQLVALAGTGIAPAAPQAVLSPASLSFGSVTAGTTSAAQTVTLSNPGTAPLSITSIGITGANAPQFAQTSTCAATLAAGASCSISVTFTPAAVASYSAAVSVTDNATGSPQSVQLTGAGLLPPPTDFSIGATNSPQTVARGTSAQYPITLTPMGGAFSSLITLSIAGLPAGATASFSPATVTPNGSPANSTLTVTTTNIAALSVPAVGSTLIRGPAAIALGILFVPWIKRRRLRASPALLLSAALLFLGGTCLGGCGAGGFAGHSPQTYTLTVTGTSGSTLHSTTVVLTVK